MLSSFKNEFDSIKGKLKNSGIYEEEGKKKAPTNPDKALSIFYGNLFFFSLFIYFIIYL